MAKEGKKLELYEILAAKRAKGKIPPGFDAKNIRPANTLDDEYPSPPPVRDDERERPGIIIDDAIAPQELAATETPPAPTSPPSPQRKEAARPVREQRTPPTRVVAEPAPIREPRPRSPREVVFALDTAMLFFAVVVALVTCSYFLGYKRGQEEKPAGLAGDIDSADPARIVVRGDMDLNFRSTLRPPEQDYTLLIRAEAADEGNLPERLELELAEAVTRGKQEAGLDIQGFIFRSEGPSPQYYLTVGLGRTANDQGLNALLQIFNNMDGLTFSRVPTPYKGCRVAQIRELGTPVF